LQKSEEKIKDLEEKVSELKNIQKNLEEKNKAQSKIL